MLVSTQAAGLQQRRDVMVRLLAEAGAVSLCQASMIVSGCVSGVMSVFPESCLCVFISLQYVKNSIHSK